MTDTFDPDEEAAEADAARPHEFMPSQLARSPMCAVCGGRRLAAIHVAPRPRCPECDRPLDVNASCPAGCTDEALLGPLPPAVTSRDRFGGRNR